MSGLDYEKAGVSLRKGDEFAEFIKSLPSKAVSRGIGGFAGGAPLDLAGYREPVLLSTTDGVGTKLLVAKKLGKYDTIGIDLVAMSVNDLVVCGAKPLQFLDYIACGRIREEVLHAVIAGVVAGCEQAGCELVGGETAEMPDVYGPDDLDLAGFAAGLVERKRMLPHLDRIEEGDLVLGMPSSGVHSNGFSLARKALAGADDATWGELLVPTRIYVKELLELISTGRVLAAAHITGSGLSGNVDRILPPGLRASFSWDWPLPPIFAKIQAGGGLPEAEMRSVFNMGVGMALVAKKEEAEGLVRIARNKGIELFPVGAVARG
ncbi:MAG TPA: phosphoribosylformylglycinamidine cyclo-ligase [Spirochaetales bacterium]|nr:phosphoribosylformylglycinamidine cyclo-ligase [Spirochaetales bacterium]HRY53786.1 phosphoribosylformylglycinamidine cyclo-ligase [Spirochaetia bacterium]HRZ64974.1 phosphoribosylformylglycinamidine cyclo-ligase [Spirochaetia bacterium]